MYILFTNYSFQIHDILKNFFSFLALTQSLIKLTLKGSQFFIKSSVLCSKIASNSYAFYNPFIIYY